MAEGSGVWFSSFGQLTIDRSGDSIRGSYEHHGGSIEGRAEGNAIRGTWREPDHDKSGPFEIAFDAGDNTFRGSWRYAGDSGWRGPWNGVRMDRPRAGDGRSMGSWNSIDRGPLLAGPMVGEVGQRDARVWVQARDGARLDMVVSGSTGELRTAIEPTESEWYCAAFVIAGLEPETSYTFRIESGGAPHAEGRFTTAPLETARRAKLTFGSCYDAHEAPLPIFDAIAREKSDALLMIGDNCYFSEPDWQSEHTMMLAQLRNRNNPTFRALGATLPVFAIWDDHDFGPNDSDGRFESKPISKRVFERVWAQRSYGLPDVTGIFSTARWGPIEMFLLDGRYERLEKHRILGDAQLAWLCERLATSAAPIKLIVTGSQLLPLAAVAKEWECWRRDAPDELERLLAFVAERDVRGVIYISGDVHLGYLLQAAGRDLGDRVGPATWELTASPLSNEPWHETILRPGQPFDPYIVREFPAQNYGVVDVDLDRAGGEIHFILKSSTGSVLVDQAIDLRDLQVEAKGARARIEPDRATVDDPRTGGDATEVERPPDRWSAALLRDHVVHFVRGDRCITYDLAAREVRGSALLQTVYPGATKRNCDAAVIWPNGKAYFFTKHRYYRFDLASGRGDTGFPLEISAHWPGVFTSSLDAAIVWSATKAFFFRGAEYVRYDIAADRVDQGYPLPIASYWKGLWPEGIDAALGPIGGKAWFLRGDEVIRYDLAADRADPGYPKPIAEEWPGLVPRG